jgi:hypothetical protein
MHKKVARVTVYEARFRHNEETESAYDDHMVVTVVFDI